MAVSGPGRAAPGTGTAVRRRGTCRSLREIAATHQARIDWAGNITFAVGLGLLLVAITYGIQPYGGRPTGWANPWVLAGLAAGAALLCAFGIIETKVPEPMFQMRPSPPGPDSTAAPARTATRTGMAAGRFRPAQQANSSSKNGNL